MARHLLPLAGFLIALVLAGVPLGPLGGVLRAPPLLTAAVTEETVSQTI